MDEHPARAMREKKDASILVAAGWSTGEADAVVTAGHTGAGMAAGILKLGRLPGVDRPGLAVQMITDRGPLVLIDIGANPDSTAENLAQYARMGAIFSERSSASPSQGSRSSASARRRARAMPGSSARPSCSTPRRSLSSATWRARSHPLPGRRRRDGRGRGQRRDQVLRGPVDLHLRPLADRVRRSWRGRLAYVLMRPSIARIRSIFDYEMHGGSPLLGVKGTVIILHGSARRRMIGFACDVAARTAAARVPDLIAEALAADRAAGPVGASATEDERAKAARRDADDADRSDPRGDEVAS